MLWPCTTGLTNVKDFPPLWQHISYIWRLYVMSDSYGWLMGGDNFRPPSKALERVGAHPVALGRAGITLAVWKICLENLDRSSCIALVFCSGCPIMSSGPWSLMYVRNSGRPCVQLPAVKHVFVSWKRFRVLGWMVLVGARGSPNPKHTTHDHESAGSRTSWRACSNTASSCGWHVLHTEATSRWMSKI